MASENEKIHPLHESWNLWAHLPQDKDWSMNSYKFLSKINTVEDAIVRSNLLPDLFIKHCMIFIMKDGIKPVWEDNNNVKGGAFSYKVSNKNVPTIWRELTYALVGNTISTDEKFVKNINGITISPKNNFCVIKIWTKTCDCQNPQMVNSVSGLTSKGCLFKQHDCGK